MFNLILARKVFLFSFARAFGSILARNAVFFFLAPFEIRSLVINDRSLFDYCSMVFLKCFFILLIDFIYIVCNFINVCFRVSKENGEGERRGIKIGKCDVRRS